MASCTVAGIAWVCVAIRAVTACSHQSKRRLFDHFCSETGKKKELVREVRAGPDRVVGKGGAVRLRTRGGTELALVSFYAPPTTGNRKENSEGCQCGGVTQTRGLEEEAMARKQWRRSSDPGAGDLLHGDVGFCGPSLVRERRRTFVLLHARGDEQHRPTSWCCRMRRGCVARRKCVDGWYERYSWRRTNRRWTTFHCRWSFTMPSRTETVKRHRELRGI